MAKPQQYPRRLARLKALADKLEQDYDEAPVTIRPQIAGQLRSTLADIAALEGPEVVTEEAGDDDVSRAAGTPDAEWASS